MVGTVTLKIDPEFRALIPPLTVDERQQLEDNLKADGCRDPLVAWKSIVIDGHNRYEICGRLGIDFEVEELDFASREDAKIWIIKNQCGRRNLTTSQRAMLAAALATLERGRPKENIEISTLCQPAAAEMFNVSRESVIAARTVLETGTPELVEKVRNDEIAVSTAAAIATAPAQQQREILALGEKRILAEARKIKQKRQEKRRQEKADQRAAAAAEAAKKVQPANDWGVRLGDFRTVGRDIPDASVDLIFTDPPYDRKTLPLYADVAELASRILKPGGSLICYLGQFQIHEVCNLVTPHLRLWWTLCCLHTGTSARMTEYGVVVKWKPMLWFVKGTRGDKHTFVDDLVESRREKDAHDWQQGVAEAAYYIDKLTMPGEFVFDPFCGGGTTAVAAKQMKRRWLTCDVNDESVKIARARIAQS